MQEVVTVLSQWEHSLDLSGFFPTLNPASLFTGLWSFPSAFICYFSVLCCLSLIVILYKGLGTPLRLLPSELRGLRDKDMLPEAKVPISAVPPVS